MLEAQDNLSILIVYANKCAINAAKINTAKVCKCRGCFGWYVILPHLKGKI